MSLLDLNFIQGNLPTPIKSVGDKELRKDPIAQQSQPKFKANPHQNSLGTKRPYCILHSPVLAIHWFSTRDIPQRFWFTWFEVELSISIL